MTRIEQNVVMLVIGIIAGMCMAWSLIPENSPLTCIPARNDAQMLNGYER